MSGGTVVTVGTFDGVHRGHHAVLEEIARRAQASGRASVLVTFEPHPLEVVNPQAAPLLLTSPDEKRMILAQSPVDRVAFLRFTPALRDFAPERFVREVLERRFDMQELVIGYDHGFGRGRSGNVDLLKAIAQDDRFVVDAVAPVMLDGRPISSTLIRRAVAGGDLETAHRALGRRYAVNGVVARGAGRGVRIGVPTINVTAHPRKLLPPDGVYAGRVAWRGGQHGAMLNLGPRPTFGETARVLEAHLFDFAGDLYAQAVTLEFVERLREVARFAGPEDLRRQLARDREAALAALSRAPGSVTL